MQLSKDEVARCLQGAGHKYPKILFQSNIVSWILIWISWINEIFSRMPYFAVWHTAPYMLHDTDSAASYGTGKIKVG